MSEEAFQRCLAVAWQPDNDGQPLHTTNGDPGGATNMGVTFSLFTAWREQHGQPAPSVDDFAAATKDELEAIIRTWVWHGVQGDQLPVGVDLMVFEAAFMSGPGRAGKILQGVLGIEQDGDIGPETLAAVSAFDAGCCIANFSDSYRAFLRGLATAPRFDRGWDRRITDDATLAATWL